ncbi:unnamed protein product [Diamesa hyperborea]
MDGLRKFFLSEAEDKDNKRKKEKNHFKKPSLVADDDDDDFFEEFNGNKFNFHGFPADILKQFEEVLSTMEEIDEKSTVETSEMFKKDFDKKYNHFKQIDRDLDGQIYADQLDSLLKRVSPQLMLVNPEETKQVKPKLRLTDEEKIMNMIHGTYIEEVVVSKPRKRPVPKPTPGVPKSFNGAFESTIVPQHHARSWGRTVISITKPDGTHETRKTERNIDGVTRTTITRSKADGTSLTETYSSADIKREVNPNQIQGFNHLERNLTKYSGYLIPNLW